MSKYYKVVTNELKSAFIGSVYKNNGNQSVKDLVVTYKENEWVYPLPGLQLMAFDNYLDAERFVEHYSWGQLIYECEIKKYNGTGIYLGGSAFRIGELYKEVLRLKKMKKRFIHLIKELPLPGTVFCKAIKLTNQIYVSGDNYVSS